MVGPATHLAVGAGALVRVSLASNHIGGIEVVELCAVRWGEGWPLQFGVLGGRREEEETRRQRRGTREDIENPADAITCPFAATGRYTYHLLAMRLTRHCFPAPRCI